MTLRRAPKLDCRQGNQVLILESLVVKWSAWKADKVGYKAGRAFVEGRAGAPAVVTDSLGKSLDKLAPIEPHIGLGSHAYPHFAQPVTAKRPAASIQLAQTSLSVLKRPTFCDSRAFGGKKTSHRPPY